MGFLMTPVVATATPGTISAILGDVTSVVTAAISWAGSYVTFITANPLVELFVILGLVGLGLGIVMRAIR